MLNRSVLGLYLLPPKKKFRWEAFHTIILLAFLVHIGLFIVIGKLLPSLPKSKMKAFNVDLVKKPKTRLVRARKPRNKLSTHNAIGVRDKRAAKKRDPRKKPSPLKPIKKKPEMPRPRLPKVAKAAPNVPIKINLPKPKYKRVDPLSVHKAIKTPEVSHEDGAPSGKKDGILGSKGVDGDKKGEGSIPADGAGEGGGDGPGDGMGGGGARPYVFWDYGGFKPGRNARTGAEKKRRYFEMSNTMPYLADAIVPEPHKLIGLGHGKVIFRVTIPAVTAVPDNGVHPENIEVLGVEADVSGADEKMKEMALLSVRSSGWYPGKRSGQPITETIQFALVFYGSYNER